ncbi:CDP-alcohol phosphatidyltransferase family protein [Arthrobacter sp. CJ23]|uniref:CDP-alcohol phosphatidyltransferase family protein n=1 Tax=Arthrobacter sp. CJ23 TaxID=2972479 RepID=UPI00215C9272|nr:CDP-alcohol phosphatidyltransferase family protein [Arthrobacter sp. CJ23]UVJ40846.1 CDP-alcohol phosphatidyltransferase family protein [Arthrobacter sp. CJ23]
MRLMGAGSRPGKPQVDHDLIFTVPNFLTVLRFMGVPLFVWLVLWQQEYGYAVLVLAIMGSTDWIDGYVARRFDQTSKLGRIMDPVADRLALIAVAVTLAIAGVVQWWYLAALVVPDAVLAVASWRYFRGHPDLPVSRIGKIRTGLLLLGTPLLVLSKLAVPFAGTYFVLAWISLGLGLLGHWVAAWNYFWAILRKGKDLEPDDDPRAGDVKPDDGGRG